MRADSAPRRVHIVGGPGSGKTTLAHQIGNAANVPVHDLDIVGYAGGAGPKRAFEPRVADVHRIAAGSAWVTEGVFLWWTEDLLRRADLIIWLDVSWPVAARRIIVRHARTRLARTNRHGGLRNLLVFLRGARRYYDSPAMTPVEQDDDAAVTRAATAEVLMAYDAKVVHCRQPADVAAVRAAFAVHRRGRRANDEEVDGADRVRTAVPRSDRSA